MEHVNLASMTVIFMIMFDTLYCCGTCIFSKYCGEIHDFICSNENSENYGLNVAYTDRCDEQEEK